ncbi:MAG: D-arabinono-1,4-lactone oxidase [Chitinophagales bacterium]
MKAALNYRFTNWAKNQSCTAKHFFQPETEEELVDIVRKHSKIRIVGTGHSWNDICLTGEALINLDLYNKVLHLDKEKLQLRVQAGIKLWQLNKYLDTQGLALRNLGSIDQQSIAGVVSTATHGSGINFQIIGSQLAEFTLIKADGSKQIINSEKNRDILEMAVVNLGCLGVISEVVLNVVPAYNLKDHTSVENFDAVIDKLDDFVTETDHFKLWWFAHTNQVVVYRYNRTQEPANDSRFRQWFMDEFLSVYMYRLLVKIGNINRDWRKKINRTLIGFISALNRIEKSHKVFIVPEPPLHRETEWAFDLSVAKDLLREYKNTINNSNHRINFIQEIRFTKGDNFALSPCYQRNSIWLGVYNMDDFGWNELLTDFEQIARKYNGRPHWGKEFTVDVPYLKQQYPKFSDFNRLRKELDPNGKFENDYIQKLFGAL